MQSLKIRIQRLWKSYIFFAAIFLVISAILLTFFLQYRYFGSSLDQTHTFMLEHQRVFWYSSFLMLLMLLILTGITRRPALSVGILTALIIAITYVHINKYDARGYPLLPEDLLLASESASLASFINIRDLLLTILAAVLALTVSIFLSWIIDSHFYLRERRQYGPWWRRHELIPRAILVVAASTAFIVGTDFVRNHSGQRYEDIPWLQTQFVAWNQARNYEWNGFILGFLYNLQKFQLTPPEGYSADAISDIRDKYTAIAESSNALRRSLASEDINFLIVLNESFMDPSTVEQHYPHTGGDITPTLTRLQSQYPSGTMYSVDYGGGTANIELEALTGLSNYWTNTVPYTSIIPRLDSVPSIASYLRSDGYATTAIHPYNGSMYKRDIALRAFGIDRFITESDMQHTTIEGEGGYYISDQSAYSEALDALSIDSEANQFVTLISMQNHLPYSDYIYGDTAEKPFQPTGDYPADPERRNELAIYYSVLHSSDRYLGDLIETLDNSEQKTVVLFFGDHLPGIFEQLVESPDLAVNRLTRETPYFVYANFDAGLTAETLPTTTPNCLVNTTLNLLGAQKPPLYYLLDEVCTDTPILAQHYLGVEGYAPTPALTAYELLNYDILGGEQYWLK